MKKLFAASLILVAIICFSFQNRDSISLKNMPLFSTNSISDSIPDNIDLAMDNLGEEMDKLGKEMEKYGKEIEKYSKQIEKNPYNADKFQSEMDKVSGKMEKLGKEMEKRGAVMEIYGKEMEKRHKKMMNWFFAELKSDGYLKQEDTKMKVYLDEKLMTINGVQVTSPQYLKYKKGLEAGWGKTFKADFSLYMNGKIKKTTDGEWDFDGNMNTDFN